jgi:DNA-directed RNA polymerase specialized sigma24 family protein
MQNNWEIDEALLEPIVARAIDGDVRAWQQTWLALDPVIERIAGRRRVTGRLADREDERRDVVVRVMEKLRANEGRLLRELHRWLQRRDGSFRPWFWKVVRNVAVSFARAHSERLAREGDVRWAEHVEVPEELPDDRLDPLQVAAVHEILAFAACNLRPVQLAAIRLRMAGEDDESIARELRLSGPEAAARTVRSGLKRLRSHAGKSGKFLFRTG